MNGRIAFIAVLVMSVAAQGALPEQPRWALGVSLRDADASSVWRIGPRVTYGLTLRNNVFTHVADWSTWTLDLDVRLTVKAFHHRTKETSWFTFLEPGLVLYEVDYPYRNGYKLKEVENESGAISSRDRGATSLAAGSGIAWVPHKRLGCFIRWGIFVQYRENWERGLPNQSWVELDKIRLTGFWML